MEVIMQPWPWYVSGPLIGFLMLTMLYFGKTFGFSSNFRTICSMLGAGKNCEFFQWDYKSQKWNLLFLVGAVVGGAMAVEFLMNDLGVDLAADTAAALESYGLKNIGSKYLPGELFSMDSLTSPWVWLILLFGGFLVGFGTRYAGGCTSGHAITGLSNLQGASLVAVIGFFIGGLLMTFLFLPQILSFLTQAS